MPSPDHPEPPAPSRRHALRAGGATLLGAVALGACDATGDRPSIHELDRADPPRIVTSVREHGARGDGEHDDAEAVNAAIAATAHPDGDDGPLVGGVVFLPAGTYRLGSSVQMAPHVTLRGAGRGATVLWAHDVSAVNAEGDIDAPVHDIAVCDLTIRGAGTDTVGHGIRGVFVERATFRDLHIHDVGGYGIGLQRRSEDHAGLHRHILIANCLIEDTGSDGIDLKNGLDRNRHIHLDHVVVKRPGQSPDAGITFGIDVRGEGTLVSNCEVHITAPTGRDQGGINCRRGEADVEDSNGLGALRSQIVNCLVVGDSSVNFDVEADERQHVSGFEISHRATLLSNCVADSCWIAFRISQERVQLSNCQAVDASNIGFLLQAHDDGPDGPRPSQGDKAILSGCVSTSPNLDPDDAAGTTHFRLESERGVLTGCVVDGNDGAGTTGVHFTDTARDCRWVHGSIFGVRNGIRGDGENGNTVVG